MYELSAERQSEILSSAVRVNGQFIGNGQRLSTILKGDVRDEVHSSRIYFRTRVESALDLLLVIGPHSFSAREEQPLARAAVLVETQLRL